MRLSRVSHTGSNRKPGCLRYTFRTVKRITPILIVILVVIRSVFAADTSFSRIKVPDAKGKQVTAVLTFSDQNRAVEVRPLNSKGITIPYSAIYKFSYEYTKRHRINEGTIITAPLGIGALAMLTKSRSHWLEI